MGEIVLPMAVLALWTLGVLLLIPVARIRAARAGRVHVKDFRYGESANVPGDVALPNRDYMNLLELPVLFYAACLALLATNHSDGTMLALAWVFVLSRVAHSLIHLLYNNVLHRLAAFAVGAVAIAIIWVRLLLWALGNMGAIGG